MDRSHPTPPNLDFATEPAEDCLAHRRLVADVLDAIGQGRPPRVDGASALGMHRLIDALLRSSETGRVERT